MKSLHFKMFLVPEMNRARFRAVVQAIILISTFMKHNYLMANIIQWSRALLLEQGPDTVILSHR